MIVASCMCVWSFEIKSNCWPRNQSYTKYLISPSLVKMYVRNILENLLSLVRTGIENGSLDHRHYKGKCNDKCRSADQLRRKKVLPASSSIYFIKKKTKTRGKYCFPQHNKAAQLKHLVSIYMPVGTLRLCYWWQQPWNEGCKDYIIPDWSETCVYLLRGYYK